MGYSVTMDNHNERFNIQFTNKGCTYCKDGKQLEGTTGEKSWYISDSEKEIQADNGDGSLQTIKINYCPMCGRKLI